MSSNSPSVVVDLVGLLNDKKEKADGLFATQKSKGEKASENTTKSPIPVDCHDCDSDQSSEDVTISSVTKKTSGLSSDWRKIFSASRKTAPSSPKRNGALSASRKNGANSPKRNAPNSSRRSAPSSPRRTNSPKRINSFRSFTQPTVLQRSLNHSLEASCHSGSSQVTFDVAPFTGLLHVQQKDLDDPFWQLAPCTRIPHREIQQPDLMTPSGNIAMSQVTNNGGSTDVPNVQFKFCSGCEREATLSQLCLSHPQTNIRALYSHYHSLTTHTSQDLTCSIRVKRNHSGRIQVDQSFYSHSFPRLILGEHMHSDVWSDVYRPRNTDEVIGNRVACAQLRDWLRIWKDKCTCAPTPPPSQTSTSKPRSKPLQSKSKTSKSSQSNTSMVNEKDNDFVSHEHVCARRPAKRVLSKCASDSEEESDNDDNESVCSAALVCGPHGCGKTAGVYAIAEELGFKVYEVNSSNVRSKVQLLSSLREATLSHQVTLEEKSTRHLNGLNGVTSSRGGSGRLMSFFQKLPKESKSIALESMTVILLDEVDVLFESDRGFWVAVYELLSATKRPFIMTCSSVDFDLDCDHIKLVFDFPPIADISLHIQVLSLVHGITISAQSAHHLAERLNCDLRKILNFLHTYFSGSCCSSFKPRLSSRMDIEDSSSNSQSTTLTELRSAFHQADAMSSIDVLSTSETAMSSHHHYSPWWKKTPIDSLVDELSDNSVIPPLNHALIYLRDIFHGQCHSSNHMEPNRAKELYKSQQKCATVLSQHMWMLSHVPLVTEGLPFIRIITDAENVRQSSNQTRRFRHYFKSFPIDICDLQNFNEVSKYQ